FVRDEPRLVPPSRSHRRTVSRVSGKTSGSGSIKLRQPSKRPITSWPNSEPRYTSPLIAGFSPGASPPPVSTPTRNFVVMDEKVNPDYLLNSIVCSLIQSQTPGRTRPPPARDTENRVASNCIQQVRQPSLRQY